MTRTARSTSPLRLATGPEPASTEPAPDFESLDDRSLLAHLLRHRVGSPDQMADRLLARFGGLAGAVAADGPELARATDLGPEVVADLKVLRALAIRLARADASRGSVITTWSALEAYARAALAHRPREQFRVLYLDHRNTLMQDELRAEGTVDHAPVYPREVVRRALELSASALILVHNHPSGDPSPSQADIEMTRRVVEAARTLGLRVHDHIIVGRHATASFRALGLL